MVAVGTQVALRPPHRSQRALLTHWAPTSGYNVQAQVGVRMPYTGFREPAVNQSIHPLPIESIALAAAKQRLIPKAAQMIPESLKLSTVAWQSVISVVPEQHNTQPLTHNWDRTMKTPSEFYFKFHKLNSNPLADAMPVYGEFPISVLTTYMGKTKEIKRLRFSFTLALAVLNCKPTKLDQPRFVLMQFQAKLRKSFPKIDQKPFSVFLVLKAHHEVIAEPDNDNLTTAMLTPPLVGPQIKHVMKIDVGKQRADTSALWYAFLAYVSPHPLQARLH